MMKRKIAALLIALLALSMAAAQAEGSAWETVGIDGTWTERAAINGDIQTHYYRIELPEQGLLEVVLQSWMERVGYKLWNKDTSHCYGETSVWYGTESEAANEVVSEIYLPAGVYYAEVTQSGDYTGEFRVKADFTPGHCNESEPNNPAPLATPLRAGETRRGMIWVDDEYDYYAFAIDEAQPVRIVAKAYMDRLTIGLRDGDELEVMDADGQPVDDESVWYGNPAEPSNYILERTLRPGNYLVMVKKNNYDGIYELKVEGDLAGGGEAPGWNAADGDTWYCPNCGTESRGNFCYNCGTANPR